MRTTDLTIILLNYNHGRYLPRSIGALLSQTVRPRELFIVDDASTDNSLEIIESYARGDSSIQIVRHERNVGVIEAFNRTCRLATSQYVGAAAADDEVMPRYIEKSMAALERWPQAGLSCAYLSKRDEVTGTIDPCPSQWCSEPTYFNGPELAAFIGPNGIGSSTAIYRRDALMRVGGYLADLKWYSDWFLNLVTAYREGICHIPEMLALITVQGDSYSSRRHEQREEHIAVLGRLLDRLLSPEFADVAPLFQQSGGLAAHGTDIVRAAARRPDRGTLPVLGLINGLSADEYEELLSDDDPKTRELSSVLLGPRWRHRQQRAILAEAAAVQSSVAGKMNRLMGRGKRLFGRLLGQARRP